MTFFCIFHRAHNDPNIDVNKLIESSKSTIAREHKIALEGDLVTYNDEIVLTHQNFLPLSKKRFEKLEANNLAIPLEKALNRLKPFKDKIWLVLEIKISLKDKHIIKAQEICKKHGFTNVIFDSFFHHRLKHVKKPFKRAKHFFFHIGKIKKHTPLADFIVLPYITSFGNPKRNYIAGAVNTKEVLQKVIQDKQCQGIFLRLNDYSIWHMALKSLTNKKN